MHTGGVFWFPRDGTSEEAHWHQKEQFGKRYQSFPWYPEGRSLNEEGSMISRLEHSLAKVETDE